VCPIGSSNAKLVPRDTLHITMPQNLSGIAVGSEALVKACFMSNLCENID
jgi:hypothetical protein